MSVSSFDPSIKILGYSLKDFPGVLDDDFRLLAFLKDFHYADSFLYYSDFDLDIRDYSWIRYEDFRLFVVYVCSDTEHVDLFIVIVKLPVFAVQFGAVT